MRSGKRIILAVAVLFIFSGRVRCGYGQTNGQISYTTYYPAPVADFQDLSVTGRMTVGEKPPFYNEMSSGTLHLQRGLVLPQWQEEMPEDPPEGMLINYYSTEGGKFDKNKMYFYDGDNWREILSLPELKTKIMVWVDTPSCVTELYICDKKASPRQWTECEFAPNIRDKIKGGCGIYSVYRSCTQASCSLVRSGVCYGSPESKVCIQVPDKKDFTMNYRPTDRRCYKGCCSSGISESCSFSSPAAAQDCWGGGSLAGYKHQICVSGGSKCGCYMCDCGSGPSINLVY